jgi:hypothetical protein
MVDSGDGAGACHAMVHELMRSAGLRPGRVRHSDMHTLLEGIADR